MYIDIINLYNKNKIINMTQTIQSLISLSDQLNESNVTIKNMSSTLGGKIIVWLSNVLHITPEWAAKHILIHQQLEIAVKKMSKEDEGTLIPSYVVEVMDDSKKLVNNLFRSVVLRSV